MTNLHNADHRYGYVAHPPDFAATYRAAGYWRGQSLGQLLRESAQRWRNRTAVLSTSVGAWSYRHLDRQADCMATGFVARGIAPGDRVVVQLPNCTEFLLVLFGLLRAGAIPVLCLPAHRAAEITHLARTADAVGYVIADTAGGFDYRELAATVVGEVPTVRQVFVAGAPGVFTALAEVPCAVMGQLPVVDPSDIALLLVSGGTTGLPKLIARTHEDYGYNARLGTEICGLTQSDVYLAALPAGHNFPLACPGILGTLSAGGAVVLTADASPEAAFGLVQQYGVTVTALVPPLARLWCAATEWETADLSSLRLLQVGGARLAAHDAKQVRPRLGAQLQQVFGMAEGLINYTRLDDSDELITTTQGRPASPDDEVRVVDSNGRDVAAGEEGQLLTRGPYTIRGYYRAAEHNGRAFTPDGWYRSGDLVRQLPSGHVVVTGRVKDVINRGGESVSCDELEEHLCAHLAIRQALAVGVSDTDLGEKICAVVVFEDSADQPTLAEIKAFLTARGLAAYKHPDMLRAAKDVPTTAVGKLDRRAAQRLVAPDGPMADTNAVAVEAT